MKKNLALLALALAMTSLASAKEPAGKGTEKKDAAVVAPAAPAPSNATKVDNRGAKASATPVANKESAKDPYAVPLFKDARSLGDTWR